MTVSNYTPDLIDLDARFALVQALLVRVGRGQAYASAFETTPFDDEIVIPWEA